ETPWSVGEAAPWAVFVLAGMLFVAWYLGRNLAGLTDTDRAAPNAKGSLGVIATILVPVLLVGISAAAWLPELSKALSPSESEPGKGVWVAAALAGSA